MDVRKLLLFLFIFISLVISVMFSLKSFTGYLISDIPDVNSNLLSSLFLVIGLIASWIYIYTFKKSR